ncbi:MAG: DUF131 domain-containing protein [Desulfurococcales archaeon]|nr:DUF131 domain-containing protein [Desulfurococcales archaeon]
MGVDELVVAGFILILLGFSLLIIGSLLKARGSAEVESGGVIVIGPIPIIFGSSDRAAVIAAVLGLVIMILVFIMMIYFRRVYGV